MYGHKVAKTLSILIYPDQSGLGPGQVIAQFEYCLHEDNSLTGIRKAVLSAADMPDNVATALETLHRAVLDQMMTANNCLTKAEAEQAADALATPSSVSPSLYQRIFAWWNS